MNRGFVGRLMAVAGLVIVLVFSGHARATDFCGCGPKKDGGICGGKSQGSSCGNGMICNLSTAKKCAGNPEEFFCACSLNDSKLEVAPTDLNFPNVNLSKHVRPKTKDYEIKNPGHVNLTVTIGGGTIPGFSFAEHSDLMIGPHKSEKFGVKFAPGSAGEYSGTIPITGNPGIGSSSAEVTLSGSASGPSATAARTPTPTATATATFSATATRTGTPTATATATATRSATATVTVTATATTTASPTATATSTPVPPTYGSCTNTATLPFEKPSVAVSGNNVGLTGLDGANLSAFFSSDGGQTFGSKVTLATETSQVIPPQCNWVGAIHYCLYYDSAHGNVNAVGYNTGTSTVIGPVTAIPNCTFPAFYAYGGWFYGACYNLDGEPYSTSSNFTTWTTPVLALSGNFAVPTLTGSVVGVVVTGQGVTNTGASNIVGTLLKGGTFGTPFNIFTAGSSESIIYGPPNISLAGNNAVIFGVDSGTSSSYAFTSWGDVTQPTPTFWTYPIATGISSVQGFLPNPPSTVAAVLGIDAANNSSSVILQGDVTIPGSFKSMALSSLPTLQLGAAGTSAYGMFAVVNGSNTTNAWLCVKLTF